MTLSRPFLLFLLAGGIAALANILSRMLYSHWMPFTPAIIAAYLTGMVTAFVLTRWLVFSGSTRPLHHSAFYFVLVNLFAVAQTGWFPPCWPTTCCHGWAWTCCAGGRPRGGRGGASGVQLLRPQVPVVPMTAPGVPFAENGSHTSMAVNYGANLTQDPDQCPCPPSRPMTSAAACRKN